MTRSLKKVIQIALILSLGMFGMLSAEVKLRIYMQDGSLRAGNLVTETEGAFVLLTKLGREEIPKNKIMYVNGKTLAQWQQRPDKFFQTEILPADVPNAAYVNDKAGLPEIPSLVKKETPAVQPIKGPINLTPVPVEKKVDAPIVTASPSPTSVDSSSVVEPQKAPVAPVVIEKKPVVVQAAPVVAPVAPVVKKPVSEPTKTVVIKPVVQQVKKAEPIKVVAKPVTVAPGSFSREGMSDYHQKKALELIDLGYKGQAIQELHMATMLNKANESGILLLGKLYQEQDATDRAIKILKMPILRKNAEAKERLAQLESENQHQEKSNLILKISTVAGVLSIFPLLIFVQRFKKRRAPQRVIEADQLQQSPPVPVAIVKEKEVSVEQPILDLIKEMAPSVSPVAINPVVQTPLPALQEKVPVKTENPKIPEPVSLRKNDKATEEREAIQKAMAMAKSAVEKNMPPVFKAEPPMPQQPPITTFPVFSIEPTFDDREEAIKVGQKGDQTLQGAHNFALEGKWEMARKEYRTVMALRPGAEEAYLGMGYVDFSEGRWDSALYYYLQALAINSHSADAHYGIGRVLLETQKTDQAVEELRKSLQLDPHFDDARDTLALLGKAA